MNRNEARIAIIGLAVAMVACESSKLQQNTVSLAQGGQQKDKSSCIVDGNFSLVNCSEAVNPADITPRLNLLHDLLAGSNSDISADSRNQMQKILDTVAQMQNDRAFVEKVRLFKLRSGVNRGVYAGAANVHLKSLLEQLVTGKDFMVTAVLSADGYPDGPEDVGTDGHEMEHMVDIYKIYSTMGWLETRNTWPKEKVKSEYPATFYGSLWKYLAKKEMEKQTGLVEDQNYYREAAGILLDEVAHYFDTRTTTYNAQSKLWEYLVDLQVRYLAKNEMETLRGYSFLSEDDQSLLKKYELQIAVIEQKWQTGKQWYPLSSPVDLRVIHDLIKQGWVTKDREAFFFNIKPEQLSRRVEPSAKTRFMRGRTLFPVSLRNGRLTKGIPLQTRAS